MAAAARGGNGEGGASPFDHRSIAPPGSPSLPRPGSSHGREFRSPV